MDRNYSLVIVAGIMSGLVIFGGRVLANMGLSLYQISVFHALFIFLLLPLIIFKKECRIRRGHLKFFVIFGFFATLSNFAEYGPILLGVPVAVVVLLLYTQPLWTVILGRIFLKEKVTINKIVALVLVLAGVFVLVNPIGGETLGNAFGVLLALMGGVLLSVWFIMGRVSGIKKYNPLTTEFGYYIFMIIFMLASYPLLSLFITDVTIMNLSFNLPIETWFYIMLYTIFALTIPHAMFFYGSRKISASDGGIIFLLEPISASILASIFFQESITLNIIIGGALILAANYLVIRSGKEVPEALPI
jgi:drug/metabolite transporter (DMT)-like permease